MQPPQTMVPIPFNPQLLLSSNLILDPFESDFWPLYSTETVVTRIFNGLLLFKSQSLFSTSSSSISWLSSTPLTHPSSWALVFPGFHDSIVCIQSHLVGSSRAPSFFPFLFSKPYLWMILSVNMTSAILFILMTPPFPPHLFYPSVGLLSSSKIANFLGRVMLFIKCMCTAPSTRT